MAYLHGGFFVLLLLCVGHLQCTAESPLKFFKNPMHKWRSFDKVHSKTPDIIQEVTVQGMIFRLLPGKRSLDFTVTVNSSLAVNDRDVFIVKGHPDGRRISITGSSGVAAASGLHYYTKNFCDCHFSWSGDQVGTLPEHLPIPKVPLKVLANDRFRYYQNVCSASYSSVWWNWSRWQREIDWMALNFINLPLGFTGQEAIVRRVYLSMGFTPDDLDGGFFSGPAFLAWNRMGNIDGWAGPLPVRWHAARLDLQHRILKRMRNFGMTPVLPAFSGHVPPSIEKYYPNASVTRLRDWGRFNSTFCCTYLLDYRDPLFQTIGTMYLRAIEAEFGLEGHVYASDTFNEMTPPIADPEYVAGFGRSIFHAMVTVDADAIWLMQGWLFVDPFWNQTLARALLTSVPIGRMIVLDLQAELRPQYVHLESFYGQPWIWCLLHNFGGVKGLHGDANALNIGVFMGRTFVSSSMVGTGIAPEGIDQNDVIYEMMSEMALLRQPIADLADWFADYSKRRYGVRDPDAFEAWTRMYGTAYGCNETVEFHGRVILTRRPSLTLACKPCYDAQAFLLVWDALVRADGPVLNADLFRHDLVDVTREVLTSVLAPDIYDDMVAAYKSHNIALFEKTSATFMTLLEDLEVLLASDVRFLLGVWLESAKRWGTSDAESALYEYNARNQITLWGPGGEILDYATKQWSGVVSDYYEPRWRLFIDTVQHNLQANETFNQTAFDMDVLEKVERLFTFDGRSFPVDPVGDPVQVATRLHHKWRGGTARALIQRRTPRSAT